MHSVVKITAVIIPLGLFVYVIRFIQILFIVIFIEKDTFEMNTPQPKINSPSQVLLFKFFLSLCMMTIYLFMGSDVRRRRHSREYSGHHFM